MRENIMLCYPFEEKRLLKWDKPYLIQRKLDGERCRALCQGESVRLISSEGHEFKFLPHINEALRKLNFSMVELDGELYTHGLTFPEIHGICSRKVNPHPEYAMIEYHIFDIINQMPQGKRTKQLESLWLDILHKGLDEEIKIVPTYLVDTLDQIYTLFDSFVQEEYEGFVLRNHSNLYVRKRSTQIMKFKPYQEDVYEIIGWQEEISIKGESKNSLGAFICRGDDGTPFSVGTGPALTREARQLLWKEKEDLKGKYLRVKYQNLTSGKGIPRFSVAIQVLDLTPNPSQACVPTSPEGISS